MVPSTAKLIQPAGLGSSDVALRSERETKQLTVILKANWGLLCVVMAAGKATAEFAEADQVMAAGRSRSLGAAIQPLTRKGSVRFRPIRGPATQRLRPVFAVYATHCMTRIPYTCT